MRVDFGRPFMQLLEPDKILLDGPEPEEFECEECGHKARAVDNRPPILLRSVVCNALSALTEKNKDMPGEEKMTRYDLAMRIVREGKDAELASEEIVLIKKALGQVIISPILYCQSIKMLEEAETAKPSPEPEKDEDTKDKVAGEIPAQE